MIPQQHGIGRIIPVALILIFGEYEKFTTVKYCLVPWFRSISGTISNLLLLHRLLWGAH
jgi:hypothetical protein